ncbi:MAG: DUF1549 domain-containing protein [Planctomycetota bacterium]
MPRRLYRVLTLTACWVTCVVGSADAEAFSARRDAVARIDRLVERHLSANDAEPNAVVDDHLFVRRAYLDVVGRIPTWQELYEFHSDQRGNRRERLLGKLIGSPGHVSHMYNWLADMLRVKDEYDRIGKTYTFHTWLKKQLAANRPWDQVVRDMLTAEGRLGESGPTAYLLRDASMPLDSLSNTMTTFLGANVACAQCHDHPFAEWTQRDFYQMAAFFGPTVFERIDTRKAAGKMSSKGLATSKIKGYLQPNMELVFFAKGRFTEFPDDYAYDDARPGERVPPKFISWDGARGGESVGRDPRQWREEFADWMTSKENPRFAAAIANRIWKKFFGVAVQEPVTDLDVLENASNPELLKYLADVMREVDFDLEEFQHILLSTQAYQRQAEIVSVASEQPLFSGPRLRRMTAEQLWDSVASLMVGSDIDTKTVDRAPELAARVFPFDVPEIVLAYGVPDIREKMTKQNKKQYEATLRDLEKQVIAFIDRDKRRSKGGKTKKRAGAKKDDWLRASELPQPMPPTHFLRVAGQSARDVADDGSTEGGIAETLALMNGPITETVTARSSPAVRAALKRRQAEEQILYLYAAFLARPPTDDETRAATRALKNGYELEDVAWALLNSREFIFVQ